MTNICLFVQQGSTLRKRKMYEEFLSKVSILGKFYLAEGGIAPHSKVKHVFHVLNVYYIKVINTISNLKQNFYCMFQLVKFSFDMFIYTVLKKNENNKITTDI